MKVQCYTFKGLFMSLVFLLSVGLTAHAQRIGGTVVDAETKEVLSGATVAVKETGKGTAADASGSFTIEAIVGQTLTVSYIGYSAKTVVIGDEKTLVIELQTNNLLEEITVSALGFQKDKAKTGYASQDVKGNDLL